jgi:hypothetical protein
VLLVVVDVHTDKSIGETLHVDGLDEPLRLIIC